MRTSYYSCTKQSASKQAPSNINNVHRICGEKEALTFIIILRSCFISESVTVLLIHPNTMIARGCKAGLYWNANLQETISADLIIQTIILSLLFRILAVQISYLLAKSVHCWSQSQLGMSFIDAWNNDIIKNQITFEILHFLWNLLILLKTTEYVYSSPNVLYLKDINYST